MGKLFVCAWGPIGESFFGASLPERGTKAVGMVEPKIERRE